MVLCDKRHEDWLDVVHFSVRVFKSQERSALKSGRPPRPWNLKMCKIHDRVHCVHLVHPSRGESMRNVKFIYVYISRGKVWMKEVMKA